MAKQMTGNVKNSRIRNLNGNQVMRRQHRNENESCDF